MMLAPVSTIAEMNTELRALIDGMGMQMDCGCGGTLRATNAIFAEAPGEREVQQRVPLI